MTQNVSMTTNHDLNENVQLNTQPKLLKTWVEDLLTHLNDIGWPVVDSIQTFGYQAYQAIKRSSFS